MAAPTKKTERFQTTQPLGEDLLGRLELATDSQNGAIVLIRRFPVRFFPDAAASQNFLQRVKTLVAQKRDGFQRVLAIGSSQGEPWLACQGSQYGTLAQLPAGTKLDADSVGRLFANVAARLDQLHSEGRVHGDIRPETLVFDTAGSLLVGETAGVHALFGWGEGPVRLPAGAVGSMVSPERVAPEVARTGVIDARADQYALALCLADSLGVRGAGDSAPNPVQAVFRFALSPNPADRYRTCSEMVQAVQTALASVRPPLLRKASLILAPIAAVVVSYLLGSMVGNAAEKSLVASQLEEQRAAIRSKYDVTLPAVASESVVAGLASLGPQATTVVDALVQAEESVQDAEFRKQFDRLKAASRLTLEADFERKVALGANPNASTPAAVLTLGDAPKFGELTSPLQWQLAVELPDVGKAVESYRLIVRALDAQGKPIGPPQETPLDLSQLDQKLNGTVPAPEGGWKAGMTVSLEAALVGRRRDEVWQSFGAAPVSVLEWKKVEVDLTPQMVKERQSEGFAVPADIEIEEGDLVRVAATGAIRPATDEMYGLMDVPAAENGPAGVKVAPDKIKRYSVVTDTANWMALLVRSANSQQWLIPSPDFAVADANIAGKVLLSINSVTQLDKKPLKETDMRFWQPRGSFKVTVLRGRLLASPDSVTDAAIRPRIMQKLERSLGVPAAEETAVARIGGKWQAADGTTVQITDTGKTVRLVQTDGKTFRKLEFLFDRDDSELVNRSGQISVAADTSGRTYDTDALLFVQGEESFSLITEEMTVVDGKVARRQKQGLQLAFNRVWTKEELEERKKLAQKTITPGVEKPAGAKKPDIKLAGLWNRPDSIFEIKETETTLMIRIVRSTEYSQLTGVVEKTPDGLRVTQWQVVYLKDYYKESYTLDAELKILDENTLQLKTDHINFAIYNGRAYESSRTAGGDVTVLQRQEAKKKRK